MTAAELEIVADLVEAVDRGGCERDRVVADKGRILLAYHQVMNRDATYRDEAMRAHFQSMVGKS